MTRSSSIVLGIGLILLWIAGLNYEATGWLTWLDGLAALVSFGIAGSLDPTRHFTRHSTRHSSRMSRSEDPGPIPVGLAVTLFALWIIGLATSATLWLSWWTFAFAVAYFVVGMGWLRPKISRLNGVDRSTAQNAEEEDRRRSA